MMNRAHVYGWDLKWNGLQKFDDNVLQERQLLKVVYGDQTLLEEMTSFIEEVVKNGGEVSKEEVVAFYVSP